MFFVFGPSGQVFRGGPAQLGQVAPVRRVQRPQALRTRAAGSEPATAAPPGDAGNVPLRVLEAVSAYVQAERGPQEPRQPLTRVREVMTPEAVTVGLDLPVHQAWRLLAQAGIGQAPVVNADGRVVGLLVRADIAPPELLPDRETVREMVALARRTVAEAMAAPVPTVTPDGDLRHVAQVLLDTGLPGLPVTGEDGRPAGFLSRADILRAVAADPPLDLWS